jgi:hypothetical protein
VIRMRDYKIKREKSWLKQLWKSFSKLSPEAIRETGLMICRKETCLKCEFLSPSPLTTGIWNNQVVRLYPGI